MVRAIGMVAVLLLGGALGFAMFAQDVSFAQDTLNAPKAGKAKATISDGPAGSSKASYAIGLNIGMQLKLDGTIDVEELVAGIRDALADKKPKFTDDELRQAMEEFERAAMARQQQRIKEIAEKNKKEGKEFLDANKAKKGVTTLPSGLQYVVLKSGTGPSPKLADTVRTHYHGTFIDGSVFDSSVERKEPAVFGVSQVIRGWTEALQRMKVGDKWKLFVPAELAYGPDGNGPVGPNSVLIFEVELLGIEK